LSVKEKTTDELKVIAYNILVFQEKLNIKLQKNQEVLSRIRLEIKSRKEE